MGLLRKVTGKTVSRKDATAQRKTFLHFDLILNRQGAKSAKVFLLPFSDRNPGEAIAKEGFTGQANDQKKHNALWAGYLLRLFTLRFMPFFINGTFQFKRKPK